MAGDWIKLQHAVFEAPEVLSIADTLNLPTCHVVGCLARIWAWVDQQSVSGNALSVTKTTIDRLCGVNGFADAMLSTGWLDGTDRNLSLPGFEKHNGNTAKKRAQTARRVSEHKQRKANATGNAKVTQEALPREEKRRYKPPKSPTGGLSAEKSAEEKTKRSRPPPMNAPQAAFLAFARSIGTEARVGESDAEFRTRVIRQCEAQNREVA